MKGIGKRLKSIPNWALGQVWREALRARELRSSSLRVELTPMLVPRLRFANYIDGTRWRSNELARPALRVAFFEAESSGSTSSRFGIGVS